MGWMKMYILFEHFWESPYNISDPQKRFLLGLADFGYLLKSNWCLELAFTNVIFYQLMKL